MYSIIERILLLLIFIAFNSHSKRDLIDKIILKKWALIGLNSAENAPAYKRDLGDIFAKYA